MDISAQEPATSGDRTESLLESLWPECSGYLRHIELLMCACSVTVVRLVRLHLHSCQFLLPRRIGTRVFCMLLLGWLYIPLACPLGSMSSFLTTGSRYRGVIGATGSSFFFLLSAHAHWVFAVRAWVSKASSPLSLFHPDCTVLVVPGILGVLPSVVPLLVPLT